MTLPVKKAFTFAKDDLDIRRWMPLASAQVQTHIHKPSPFLKMNKLPTASHTSKHQCVFFKYSPK